MFTRLIRVTIKFLEVPPQLTLIEKAPKIRELGGYFKCKSRSRVDCVGYSVVVLGAEPCVLSG